MEDIYNNGIKKQVRKEMPGILFVDFKFCRGMQNSSSKLYSIPDVLGQRWCYSFDRCPVNFQKQTMNKWNLIFNCMH